MPTLAPRGFITRPIAATTGKVRFACLCSARKGSRRERIDAKAKAPGIRGEEMRNRLLDTVSLRTFVSPQDIANMALFLATDAGKHITGQALSVCGDVQRTV